MKQFNLPELRTKDESPAVIVIPIAIYALHLGKLDIRTIN